jgi:PAS domain S-box-containing protein
VKGQKLLLRAIERAVDYLTERYCPFRVKTFQVFVAVVTAVVLATVLVLGWMSSKKVKEVVTSDFNQQQLVLAQHASRQIENKLNILKKELALLSLSPSIQYFEKVSLGKRMGITFRSIQEEGLLEIQYVESSGAGMHVVDSDRYQTMHPDPESLRSLAWARQAANKGKILISDITPVVWGNDYHKLIMKMSIPVWQVSVDGSNPVATNKFSGLLMFLVDTTALVEKIVRDIRSGKTGYAWVMDDKGTFLYHPETEFIGKNAFEARKEKKRTISFTRINEIQKEMMLRGREGTSWYISGWHRGREGELKKLIAYAPSRLDSLAGSRIWSVAVVAPVSEVEGVIHTIQSRQFLLEGIVILAIVSGGLLLIGIMLRWSSALTQQVEEKTRELQKSESRCRSLLEHADDIIFTVGRDRAILSMNSFGYHFFQKGPAEVLGRGIETLFTGSSGRTQTEAVEEVFRTAESGHTLCPVGTDGNEHWLSTNFGGLVDEKGEAYAVLGIARDITQRKKMEKQMFYTEKLASIGTLAAGVAHEINNPLAIILGFSDLLIEKTPPGSEPYEMLKTIEKHGTNAKRVVENLLSFTRLTEHKEEDVDINKNIEAVLAVVGNTATIKKIAVDKRLSQSLPVVKGDAGELQQVLFNIINNAVYAMNGGGVLTIATGPRENDRKVEIRISDTGCGIKKEHRTRLFDPLFTTKKVGEGTGLGLFVSYGIIAKHGGTITFETRTKDESPEPGTTFIITLPEAHVHASTA